jgi:peptidoglycan biosynthesis protein MviN/MurJ (putative lipid II flippase)
MLLVGMVAAGVLWLLSPWLVEILFERGAFSPADTQAVAEALRWGVWQLPPYLVGLVLVSQLASEGRYVLIGLVAFLNIAVKAACTSLLVDRLGLTGILLATVVMYSVAALSFWYAVVSGAPRNLRR